MLKEHGAGVSASDLCRKHGISDATFYKWRSRYGGMEISDARKLKKLLAMMLGAWIGGRCRKRRAALMKPGQ
jgi:transposase-like protein